MFTSIRRADNVSHFYNFLVRRNKSVMERVRAFGAQLHTALLAGTKRRARSVRYEASGTKRQARADANANAH
ncbi:hypothetical protein [Paraburkholderia sp. GAS348]|uniref:hypothetical protein n=1 Tax=Paraburkholderia sp. GAS348 TaxID=3035132 RepID=UPI003D1D5768